MVKVKLFTSKVFNKYELILIAVLFCIPFIFANEFFLSMLVFAFIWAIAAGGPNLFSCTGNISLGHAAYFGIGAWVSLVLYINYNISPWLGMIVGGIAATVFAAIFGYPTLKLNPVALTFATLTFPLILTSIAQFLNYIEVPIPFIGDSLQNFQFTSKVPYYFISLIFMIIYVLFMKRLSTSRIGLFLKAIKENEEGAKAAGVNVLMYKWIALVISAFITGVAGAIYLQFLALFTPEIFFGFNTVATMTLISVVGGLSTPWGSVVGSLILTPLGHSVEFLTGEVVHGAHLVLYGLILMVVVVLIPEGLVARVQTVYKNKQRLRSA